MASLALEFRRFADFVGERVRHRDFGATPRRFDSKSAVGAQIIRLAATLPSARPSRLERLHGFGAGFGRALTCACSRVVNADGTAAVLVVATEAAGQALPLAEWLRRLFPGPARPVAAFAPDGALVFANHAALERVGGLITLAALGIEATARRARKFARDSRERGRRHERKAHRGGA